MVSVEHMDVENKGMESAEKPKRKLEKTILDNFSKLVNPNEVIRVKSATNLLRYLVEKDEEHKESEEIKYALKRLIRGLGSSTPSARSGFYSALVSLLNFNDNIKVGQIFECVTSELHRSAKNSDGENADICTGQILAYGAIIRSKLWKECSNEDRENIVTLMLKSSKERSYLGLVAYAFIVELEVDCLQKSLFKVIKTELSKEWKEYNLDTLFLLLSLKNKCPNLIKAKFLKNSIGTTEIICEENIERLVEILMTIPRVTSLKHPVYDLVAKEITNSEFLKQFSNELDNHLRMPNRNRLLAALKINSSICSVILSNSLNFEVVPELLTKNFIQQTLTYFKTFEGKQKDPDFQKAVHKLFESILKVLKHEKVESNIKISVLKKFLFYPGTFIFEKVTKSKIIQQITATLDVQGIKNLAKIYKGVLEGTERIDSNFFNNEHWLNNDRLYATHLLIKLLNHPNIKTEIEWKADVLENLMKIVIFKEENVHIGRELADSLKVAFFGALDLKLSKLEDLQIILSRLVHKMDNLLNSDNLETILRRPISVEAYEVFQKTLGIISKIEKKKKKTGLKSVFLTLFLHLGLQIFNDLKLACDSLNELFICYDRTQKNKKEQNEENNDPDWIEVVIDLFLNLLSHNSHLLRSVVKSVFPFLCHYMTGTTIHQILSVLDPKNDENPLSKDSDSDSDEGEEEENSEEEEESAEEEEEEEEEEESNNDRLRMALHRVLSKNNESSDIESVDLDEISENEGEKLDEEITEVFRQFKPNYGKKKKQSKDQETLTHFRVRVLDLVEIYLDSSPSMLLALEVMLPLLQAVEFSVRDGHQKPLNDRLKSTLKKFVNLKKFCDFEGVDDAVLSKLLESLLDKGTKNVILVQEMGEQIADCCIFVVKCSEMLRSFENTPKKVKKSLKNSISEVLCRELQGFFMKRDNLTPYVLFKNLLNLNNCDGNINIVAILLSFVFNSEVKNFKKSQATELLRIFYNNQRYLSQKVEKINSSLSQQHENFSNETVTFFKRLCEDPDIKNVKDRFICNVFNLLSAMKNCVLKIDNINWVEIGNLIREYRSHKTFSKDTKLAFNKLCRSLGVSNVVKMKNKPSKVSNDDNESIISNEDKKKDKKKKKVNKEKLKLKKEAKAFRLESLSEGFSTKLDFKVAENDTEEIEEETDRKQKVSESSEEITKKSKKKRSENVTELQNGDVSKKRSSDEEQHKKKKRKNS